MELGRPKLVVGFAAETDDVLANAESKRGRKGCDWIIANDVSPGENCVMGGERNSIILITDDGDEEWPDMPKIKLRASLPCASQKRSNKNRVTD